MKRDACLDEIDSLQEKVSEQIGVVDLYIKTNRNTLGKSETFNILDSLYTLFKSEEKINKTLRARLNDSSRQLIKIKAEQTNFFSDISEMSNKEIQDFDEALEFIQFLATKTERKHRTLTNEIIAIKDDTQNIAEQLEKDNKNYQKQLKQQAEEIQEKNLLIEGHVEVIKDLQSQVEEYKTINGQLKTTIAKLNGKLEKKKHYKVEFKESTEIAKREFQAYKDALDLKFKKYNEEKECQLCKLTTKYLDEAKKRRLIENQKIKEDEQLNKLKQENERLRDKMREQMEQIQEASQFLSKIKYRLRIPQKSTPDEVIQSIEDFLENR